MDFGGDWISASTAWLSDAAYHGALFSFVLAALLSTPDLVLIAVYAIRHKRMLAREQALLTAQRPADPRGLSVCVQLALYNEAEHVEAAIDSMARLRWPRDRLEFFIVEDSTDETTELARARVEFWRSEGLDMRLLHRQERKGYKAGALADATKATTADFIAIFDADYRPPVDFLEKLVPLLADNGQLAYVQARLDYVNRNQNSLTRAQAIELDIYYAYEQAARAWAGIPTPFNGTCGIWRRAAIDDAGGWSDRTLAEDQELSYRAFARGWTSETVTTLAVQGELPSDLQTLLSQRRRWSSGASQTLRGIPSKLLARLALPQALLFTLLLSFHVLIGVLLCAGLSLLGLALALGATETGGAWFAVATAICTVVLLKSIGAILAGKTVLNLRVSRVIEDLVRMWLLQILLQPFNAVASLRGLLIQKTLVFTRTPKTGVTAVIAPTNLAGQNEDAGLTLAERSSDELQIFAERPESATS